MHFCSIHHNTWTLDFKDYTEKVDLKSRVVFEVLFWKYGLEHVGFHHAETRCDE